MPKLSFGLLVAAAMAISLGVSSSGAVTVRPLVAVQVDEFSVFPQTQGAPAGRVRFVVTNIGTIEHEFVVIKTNKPAGNLLKGKEADETGAVGELDGVKAGNARVLVLKLTRGHYALLCNLPGHYRTGQFADFYVR
jgi:methenyltetrahydromethanopterin cyclohydrolase